ncbi:MAG: phosphopantetheine-binding protein [Firmicutes bacterium]|nr:phosphopantetheine-binding protein [Bacillota bacterium]
MYDIDYIKSVIRETIGNRGLDFTEDTTPIDLDSLQFISMVVEFEEALNITIDDDYLFMDRFASFTSIEDTLVDILENTSQET